MAAKILKQFSPIVKFTRCLAANPNFNQLYNHPILDLTSVAMPFMSGVYHNEQKCEIFEKDNRRIVIPAVCTRYNYKKTITKCQGTVANIKTRLYMYTRACTNLRLANVQR